MMLPVSKYHSYGNDFLVLMSGLVKRRSLNDFAQAVCEPHFGLGADGCIFMNMKAGDISLRIFNRDGSEAGMSANGARCASAFLHHRGLVLEPELRLNTPSGRKIYRLKSSQNRSWIYQSDLGRPAFQAGQIPFRSKHPEEEIQDYPLQVLGRKVRVHALNVGNPQCVVFVDSLLSDEEFLRLGAALEKHRRFPERTNVSFVRVVNSHHLKIQIWERGVGPTFSSGTGSCGAAVAAIRHGLADSPVTVETSTGKQRVRWYPGKEIRLSGKAEFIADIQFFWRRATDDVEI